MDREILFHLHQHTDATGFLVTSLQTHIFARFRFPPYPLLPTEKREMRAGHIWNEIFMNFEHRNQSSWYVEALISKIFSLLLALQSIFICYHARVPLKFELKKNNIRAGCLLVHWMENPSSFEINLFKNIVFFSAVFNNFMPFIAITVGRLKLESFFRCSEHNTSGTHFDTSRLIGGSKSIDQMLWLTENALRNFTMRRFRFSWVRESCESFTETGWHAELINGLWSLFFAGNVMSGARWWMRNNERNRKLNFTLNFHVQRFFSCGTSTMMNDMARSFFHYITRFVLI